MFLEVVEVTQETGKVEQVACARDGVWWGLEVRTPPSQCPSVSLPQAHTGQGHSLLLEMHSRVQQTAAKHLVSISLKALEIQTYFFF